MTGKDDTPSSGRPVRASEIFAEPPGSGNFSSSIGAAVGIELFQGRGRTKRARPSQTIVEPEREVPVLTETDVLVVGGGPAGTAAAIAAARLGADVLLAERYNHLGGLSTGGLVIWIDRMSDWSGRHIIRGLAEDLVDRLPKGAVAGPPRSDWGSRDTATAAYWAQRTAAYHGVVTWSPTIDPEALKTLSMQSPNKHKCGCCSTLGRRRRLSRAIMSRASSSKARKAATRCSPRSSSIRPAMPI